MKPRSPAAIKRHPIALAIGVILTVGIVLLLLWKIELWPFAVFALPLIVATALYVFDIAKRYSRWRIAFFISVAATAFFLCLPFYRNSMKWDWLSAIFMSVQHALRLFVLDGEFPAVVSYHQESATLPHVYAALASFLCLFAPMLTFTLLLSIVKNLTAKGKYVIGFFRRVHVFSELNEKSLALAKSLIDYPEDDLVHETERKRKKGTSDKDAARSDRFEDIDNNAIFPENMGTKASVKAKKKRFCLRPLIVFTDVLDKHEEEHYDLTAEAKEINAILFRKDLASVKFRTPWLRLRRIAFYLISEDEPEKIRHAKHIMKEYNDERTQLFVFSNNIETQLLLDSTEENAKISKRRIDDIQSLVYHNLDQHGLRLFQNAQKLHFEKYGADSGTRAVITAVIVGLGQYGLEMLKALLWYCQMVGFRLEIHAFDERENASSRLYALCPELKRPAVKPESENEWEDDYYPTVYDHIAVDTDEFAKKIQEIENATYVFVSLGSDELNISTSIHIRSLYAQIGREPDIETIVYDSNISKKMSVSWEKSDEVGVKNSAGQPYNIHMTGDLENFYSAKTLLRSDLDEAGKICELRWTFSSLLGKRDEVDVLADAKRIAQTAKGFNPDTSIIFFEKKPNVETLSAKDKYYASILDVKTLFRTVAEKKALNNLALKKCDAICSLLRDLAESKNPKKTSPTDPVAILAAAKSPREIVFVHEDIVSEKMIFHSAFLSKPAGAKPEECVTFDEEIATIRGKMESYSAELRAKDPIGYRKHEYNYRASLTRAVRERMRQMLLHSDQAGVTVYPDGCWTEKEIQDLINGLVAPISLRTLDQMAAVGKLEHVAWNAYMRTEGFSRGAKTNRLAKQHQSLKPVSALDAKELRKDA